ncbi:MAG: hypothetical protein E6772_03650 [Dysgonomonas sp.]|nr:hypothetical protein [Dysgonomonas sp.]
MYTYTSQPKNRIIEEFNKLIIEPLPQEKLDIKLYNYYNKHASYFEKVEDISGNSLISKWIYIKIIYIRILETKSEYKEAEKICDEVDILLNKLDKEYYKYEELFKLSIFWKGVILGYLTKYTASSRLFKQLLDSGEVTQKNKNWYIYSLRGLFIRYCNYIMVPAIIMGLADLALLFIFDYRLSGLGYIYLLICLLYLFKDVFEKKIITYYVNKKYKTDETI